MTRGTSRWKYSQHIHSGSRENSPGGDTNFAVVMNDRKIILGSVTAFPNGSPPDLTLANTIDLDADLPVFTPHNMALTIPEATLKYIEGLPVLQEIAGHAEATICGNGGAFREAPPDPHLSDMALSSFHGIACEILMFSWISLKDPET